MKEDSRGTFLNCNSSTEAVESNAKKDSKSFQDSLALYSVSAGNNFNT